MLAEQCGCVRRQAVSSWPMGRLLLPLLALAVLTAACTSSSNAEVAASTSSIAPVTTLASTGEAQATTTLAATTTATQTTPTTIPIPENECVVTANTSTEGYAQGCTVLAIRILAEEEVDPAAIDGQADRIFNMLMTRPDLITAIQESGIDGRVIPASSRITSVPDYANLYDDYPGTDWNRLGRSFPGTELLPFFAGAEENLLCSTEDPLRGRGHLRTHIRPDHQALRTRRGRRGDLRRHQPGLFASHCRRPLEEHACRDQRRRVLDGGRPELLRRQPRGRCRGSGAQLQPQCGGHQGRARRVRPRALGDRPISVRRYRVAPHVPVSFELETVSPACRRDTAERKLQCREGAEAQSPKLTAQYLLTSRRYLDICITKISLEAR